MINQIGRLKDWTTFQWIGKGTSAGLFKKDDVFLEYVNAWTFLGDYLFTSQNKLFLIGVN
jgi:hypothetical protein